MATELGNHCRNTRQHERGRVWHPLNVVSRISKLWLLASLLLTPLGSCTSDTPVDEDQDSMSDESETGDAQGHTWWHDVEPIVSDRCSCHEDGDIAPFSLAQHDEFVAFASLAGGAIESGEMPPWPPDEACNTYKHPRSLTPEQEEILLTYIAGDMPEGDPADAPPPVDPPTPFVPDIELVMPEAYTPMSTPDDYRCFLIPWPEDIVQERFVTGFDVTPGERSIVHHVIMYAIPPEEVDAYMQLDGDEPGPGYTCFGGPGGPPASARWVGGWVPSVQPFVAPAGVGQRIEPGSVFVAQVHYNAAAGSTLSDRTTIGVTIEESVERRAVVTPVSDIAWLAGNGSMLIPAGDPNATHAVSLTLADVPLSNAIAELGATPGSEFEIWNVGLHLHLIGKRARLAIERNDGSSECLVEVPDWDFHWQSSYDFVDPIRLTEDDTVHLQCWWDNSAENQPIVDGQQLDPIDRDWGEGTLDEMCLGILYVAATE
jgi:hypothetical protein